MSPRPRKATDEAVFAAAVKVMERVGPAELTLAAIAEEAGVTPAALVQRFGSKRELLVALSRRAAAGAPAMIAALRARHGSPLAVIRAFAAGYAGLARSPDALARNLAYLQLDLTDPELHRPLLAQARVTGRALTRLAAEAVAAGELRPGTRPAGVARLVETVISGSLMTWAVRRRGTAAAWLRRDLELALGPHLAPPRRPRR
ncbi:MAG: TetR/AcrR family transcriptional regulator [Acidobacteriota bacterium]